MAGVRGGFGGAIPLECRPKISMAVKKKCNFERRISLNWWSAGPTYTRTILNTLAPGRATNGPTDWRLIHEFTTTFDHGSSLPEPRALPRLR